MSKEIEQAEFLARVAHLYFEKGYDQGAIARQLKVSRSSVSRLLSLARRQGIVEIRIHYPLLTSPELASALQNRFGLKEAIVLKTTDLDTDATLTHISLLAARYLEDNLHDGSILAISWGSTIQKIVQDFHPSRRLNVQVVQLVGTLGASKSEIDGAHLVRHLAEAIGGKYFNLNAPLIVEAAGTQMALMQEPSICEVLDLARKASVALVGIGAVARAASSAFRAKLLGASELRILKEQNAVGDVCSQYFDIFGCPVAEEINRLVIGLDLESLQRIPNVVGVAVGQHKEKSILGALRGRFINVLITNEVTADHVLHLDQKIPMSLPSATIN